MYNSYLNNDNYYYNQFANTSENIVQTVEPCEQSQASIKSTAPNTSNNSIFSNMFSGFKIPELTTETLILFAVIYFSIYDDFDMDLLIIIGVLFLLGI